MTKQNLTSIFLVATTWVLTLQVDDVLADQPDKENSPVEREIFVPFGDLHVILDSDAQRVFMTREEYDSLAAKAERARRPEAAKQPAAILSAAYKAKIEEHRARMTGTLIVTAPDENIHAVVLDLSGVALRSAMLDDKPVAIGRNPEGIPVLFVSGAGRHTLTIEILAPIETAAAQRSLSFQVPTPPAAQLQLSVPGNIEIKSGATIIRRIHNENSSEPETVFNLLPRRGQNTLVMSLNNRQLQKDRVVVAHSVVFDQITTAFEKLNAKLSLSVLHGAADQFQFDVPSGFEVLSVSAPELSRWAVNGEGENRVLEVQLHEPTSETVSLNIVAVRTPTPMTDWKLPKLTAKDVAGQATVIGLILENRLKPQDLRPQNLIPIDAQSLRTMMPIEPATNRDESSKQTTLAAYYAPRSDYGLQGSFVEPPTDLRVTTGVFLSVNEKGLEARGSFSLTNGTEKTLAFDFLAPVDWQIAEITFAGGKAIPFETYAEEANLRIHVRLTEAIEVGQQQTIYFRAVNTPDGWLNDWTTKKVDFPVFQVADTTADLGAIAVQTRDDMQARVEMADRLTPLDSIEKAKYGLSDVPTELAYRFAAPPYTLNFVVSRVAPRVTAKSLSFFRVESDLLNVHDEIIYEVSEARTSRLKFALPLSAPTELAIRALDGASIKESSSETVDDLRHWTVQLTEPRSGTIRLAIDFQVPVAENVANAAEVTPPIIRALDVTYQLGNIAIEGSADQDVEIKTKLRKLDVGELAEAEYVPGRRLLGAFGYGGDKPDLQLSISRPAGYDLPTALVERAELVTVVSSSGQSQTAARFQLRAKAQMIELRLPKSSTLWSVHFDGQPVLPQREADSLLIDLPASAEATRRNLQVVYETSVSSLGLLSNLALPAPKLFLRSKGNAAGEEIPLANLQWQFSSPDQFQIVRNNGTVMNENVGKQGSPMRMAVQSVTDQLPLTPTVQFARETARRRYDTPPESAEPTSAAAFEPDFDASHSLSEDVFDVPQSASTVEPSAGAHADPFSDFKPSDEPVMSAPAPPAKPAITPTQNAQAWAFQGLRSLPIELQTSAAGITFHSLGESPRLDLTIIDRHRFKLLAWAVGLMVFLRGVLMTGTSLRRQVRYVLLVMGVALAIPLAVPRLEPLSLVCDWAFVAACWLLGYFFAVLVVRGMQRLIQAILRTLHSRKTVVATIAIGLLFDAATLVNAEEPPPKPVKVPADAIIVPYDPTTEDPLLLLLLSANAEAEQGTTNLPPFGSGKRRKILVPYAKYLELRRATNLEGTKVTPPAAYAFAGAEYKTTLAGEESLVIEGQLQIDLYVDQPVRVPIGLSGGVLTKITADGQDKTASIGLAVAAAEETTPRSQKAIAALDVAQPARPSLTLVLSGRGRHQVNLSVRFPLERRGGWQIAAGRLPVASAAALTLDVPNSGTEVVLSGGVDGGTIEIEHDNQTFESALTTSGQFRIQWRPKTGRAPIDQSLVARAFATFDVQEDALRMICRFDLSLRRDQRESFMVEVPEGYAVEKVIGANIRGWTASVSDGKQKLEVTLLKAAQESESFTVELTRRAAVGAAGFTTLSVPLPRIMGAAQESGELKIRRSPLMELRTERVLGATRADNSAESTPASGAESPLGMLPYQAYHFPTAPYSIELSAHPVEARMTSEIQTVLKVSERQRTLETRIRLRVQNRPIYRLRIALPKDWSLDHVVAPQPFEWVIATADDRPVLDLYLARGVQGSFDVILSGPLGEYGLIKQLDVPRLEIVDAGISSSIVGQAGQVVVQADPALNVRAVDLKGCEAELLSRTHDWLTVEQRPLARLALRYRAPQYLATLKLSRRMPIVHCQTVTNVRVTRRTIEETILLDFNIRDAGIREVTFLLPESMRDARISVPLLRQKTIEPVGEPENFQIRVRLALQDEVMNDFRVLVENDRLLTDERFSVPIPQVETGETDRRYVALESAGRDEVLVEKSVGVDALEQEQTQWRMLVDMLGRGLTQAYLVGNGAAQPELVLRSQDRATVETAGARIGLAKTTLAIDANGAYRAAQLYRVDNSLEQYLDIQLPAGAKLWTAHVAGEPVKPVATKVAGQVRIPLVKTATGDADYPVVLKYGGELGSLGSLTKVDFPFLRTLNINVELSQVELYVPPSYRWMNFGGTMRVVSSEGDLAAGQLAYNTKQIGLALEALRGKDSYARVRAMNNLKSLQETSELLRQSSQQYEGNKELEKQLRSNSASISQFGEELNLGGVQSRDKEVQDNRGRLNYLYSSQLNGRASEVAGSAGKNFEIMTEQSHEYTSESGKDRKSISNEWFAKNKLEAKAEQLDAKRNMSTPAIKLAEPQQQLQADFGSLAKEEDGGEKRGAGKVQMGKSSGEQAQQTIQRYSQRLDQQQSGSRSGRGNGPRGGALADEVFSDNVPIDAYKNTQDINRAFEQPGYVKTESLAIVQSPLSQSGQSPISLASLDVELEPQGIKYLLTTPRGDVRVTAQAISDSLVSRVLKLIAIGVFIVVALAVLNWLSSRRFLRNRAAA